MGRSGLYFRKHGNEFAIHRYVNANFGPRARGDEWLGNYPMKASGWLALWIVLACPAACTQQDSESSGGGAGGSPASDVSNISCGHSYASPADYPASFFSSCVGSFPCGGDTVCCAADCFYGACGGEGIPCTPVCTGAKGCRMGGVLQQDVTAIQCTGALQPDHYPAGFFSPKGCADAGCAPDTGVCCQGVCRGGSPCFLKADGGECAGLAICTPAQLCAAGGVIETASGSGGGH